MDRINAAKPYESYVEKAENQIPSTYGKARSSVWEVHETILFRETRNKASPVDGLWSRAHTLVIRITERTTTILLQTSILQSCTIWVEHTPSMCLASLGCEKLWCLQKRRLTTLWRGCCRRWYSNLNQKGPTAGFMEIKSALRKRRY